MFDSTCKFLAESFSSDFASWLIGDVLNAIGPHDDSRPLFSNAEVITTALVIARFFGESPAQSRTYLSEHCLIPQMLSPSRSNRPCM